MEERARVELGHQSDHHRPGCKRRRANVTNGFRTPDQGQYGFLRMGSFCHAPPGLGCALARDARRRLGFSGDCGTLPDRPWRLTALVLGAMRRKRPWQSGRQSSPACGVPACSCHSASGFSPSVDVATAFGAFPGPASSWPESQVVQDGLPRHLGLPVFLSATAGLIELPVQQPFDDSDFDFATQRAHLDGQVPNCRLPP